jgi:hypothetical protein
MNHFYFLDSKLFCLVVKQDDIFSEVPATLRPVKGKVKSWTKDFLQSTIPHLSETTQWAKAVMLYLFTSIFFNDAD